MFATPPRPPRGVFFCSIPAEAPVTILVGKAGALEPIAVERAVADLLGVRMVARFHRRNKPGIDGEEFRKLPARKIQLAAPVARLVMFGPSHCRDK